MSKSENKTQNGFFSQSFLRECPAWGSALTLLNNGVWSISGNKAFHPTFFFLIRAIYHSSGNQTRTCYSEADDILNNRMGRVSSVLFWLIIWDDTAHHGGEAMVVGTGSWVVGHMECIVKKQRGNRKYGQAIKLQVLPPVLQSSMNFWNSAASWRYMPCGWSITFTSQQLPPFYLQLKLSNLRVMPYILICPFAHRTPSAIGFHQGQIKRTLVDI